MKPQKLVSDPHAMEQTELTYRYGKNGVWYGNQLMNELGFLLSSSVIPYQPIGTIETDLYPIVFSTDGTYSAIGFLDVVKDIYVPIVDDSAQSYKLGFSFDHPIKGEARRNYLGQIEITWFEFGNANPPRFMNTTSDPSTMALKDYLLFQQFDFPLAGISVGGGGNLGMGAYFFSVRYLKKDGTQTRHSTLSAPVFATDDNYATIPGTNTGKAITLVFTEMDTRYDTFIIGVVQRINGVDSAYELQEMTVAASVTYTYTGSEIATQITLDEILVPGAFYENVQAMAQLNDTLYMADTTEEEEIDLQQYANLVKVRWNSNLLSAGSHPCPANDSGTTRGFMHEETYAFYIAYKTTTGKFTRGFILPGPAPVTGDTDPSTKASAQGVTAKVFQVEDACQNIDTPTRSGDFCPFINVDELYPDIPDFDSTPLGGENLRGAAVRHHKFPSLRFCKNQFYIANNDYGRGVMDVLGLDVTAVQIPPALVDRIIGWEIFYAQRDVNNSTIAGQSLMLFGAHSYLGYGQDKVISSTGGNWCSYQKSGGSGSPTDPESMQYVNNYVRMHSFDMLANHPAISPTHLSIQLKQQVNFSGSNNILGNDNNNVIFWMDYTGHNSPAQVPLPVTDDQNFRRIDKNQYLVNDEIQGPWDNTRLEGCYGMHLPVVGTDLLPLVVANVMRRDYTPPGRGNTPPLYEQTYLANIVTLRSNMYLSYYNQTLARTGYTFDVANDHSTSPIYGGDIFLSICSFNTYGLVNSLDVQNEVNGHNNWDTLATDGIKVVRTFIAETVSNCAGRYVLPGNSYSLFMPVAPTGNGTRGYLINYSRDTEPNQIGYSKDTNAIGTLLNGIAPASPFDKFVVNDPYKIIRSVRQISEGKVNGWKNFNALDYFETTKNRGPVNNLQGMGDILIIHHQDGFYRTRDKETLNTNIATVTLGSGDIFAITPKEIQPGKLGNYGTSHPLACYLTPHGYVFPDARTGEILLYDGEQMHNLSTDIEKFLSKYMRISDTNVFTGNGITIGYDWQPGYKRILLTIKSLNLVIGLENFIPGYEATPAFFAGLMANTSIVYVRGRFLLFKGVNSSGYTCPGPPSPSLSPSSYTLDAYSADGTTIATLVATGGTPGYSYTILSGNTGGAIALNSATGRLYVANQHTLVYSSSPFLLSVKVTDRLGNAGIATITVNLNNVPSTPVMPDQSFSIPENAANTSVVGSMTSSNGSGGTPVYSILSGNSGGWFAINSSTGQVTVNDDSTFDYTVTPVYNLVIQVVYGTTSTTANCQINLTFVARTPTYTGSPVTWTTPASTPNGTIFGTYPATTCRDPVTYAITAGSNPGGIIPIVDQADPNWRAIEIGNNTLLTTGVDNTFTIRVTNNADPTKYVDFNILIHIS